MNNWSITRPCSEMSFGNQMVVVRRNDERRHAEDRHHQEQDCPKTLHNDLHDCGLRIADADYRDVFNPQSESESAIASLLSRTYRRRIHRPLLRLARRFERQRLDVIDDLPNLLLVSVPWRPARRGPMPGIGVPRMPAAMRQNKSIGRRPPR